MEQLETNRNQTRWYVVHCQPLKERQAATLLEEQLGVTVYLPEVKRRFRGEMRYAPLFPRYLFVRADMNETPPSAINALPGVVRLVTYGIKPQPVPARIIATIQEQLELLDEQGGLPAHTYQSGDMVQLRSGPFQGLEALFVGPMHPCERVRVLLDFMGQLREVEIDVEMLETSRAGAPAKRERRTRGRGRPIKHYNATS